MNKAEMKELIEALADEVKGYIDERIAALPAPLPGRDADPEQVRAAVLEAVAAIPPAPPGKDADPEVIRAMVREAVAEIPPPAPGRDADPAQVRALVAEAVAALPPAAPGKDADPAVVRALVQEAVDAIPRPKDGEGVTVEDVLPLLEAGFVKWMAEVERRANDRFEAKLAEFRQPKDGADGLGIEDLDVTHDGEGNVALRFSRGQISREFKIRIPCFKDRGVFREDETYREGHAVSFGGSLWIAQKDNPEGKPEDGSGDWRLAVKRGRNGKDAGAAASTGPQPVRYGR